MIKYTPINIRTWSILGSRGTAGLALLDIPDIDDKMLVLTADQCVNSGLVRFKSTYSERFFNVGIAEQNMITIAAALAKEGFNPFVTAQAPFASMRCTDQVRVSMGYMGLGVKLIGLASGFVQGEFGATHECINDLAVIRSIPGITILSPADCTETVKAIETCANNPNPVYIRLTGTINSPIVYKSDYEFEIGKAITLKEGHDIAIVATGSMVYNSLKAAELLEANGISVKVIDMHTIKPIDGKALEDVCSSKLIVTVEEHSIIGGLGSAVAEYLAPVAHKPPLCIIGAKDGYLHADEYLNLIEESGLTAPKIAEKIVQEYQKL